MIVSQSRRPLKPCFMERCPHCRRIGEFWLVELSGYVAPVFGGVGYSIACAACNFEKLIDNAEAEIFKVLAGQYRRVLDGLLSVEAFEKEMGEAHLVSLEEIKNESIGWICPKCSEENPLTFDMCWQCGTPSPRPSSDSELLRVPDVGGRYAWE